VLVSPEDWSRLGSEARAWGCRWVAGWGEEAGKSRAKNRARAQASPIRVNACFEVAGAYLVARTALARATPALSSHTASYPVQTGPERHIRDMLGVTYSDHPDARRWTRHQAWKDSEFPLRREFPAAGRPQAQTPADHQYSFLHAQGIASTKYRRAGARRHHRTGAFPLSGGGRDRAQAGKSASATPTRA